MRTSHGSPILKALFMRRQRMTRVSSRILVTVWITIVAVASVAAQGSAEAVDWDDVKRNWNRLTAEQLDRQLHLVGLPLDGQ